MFEKITFENQKQKDEFNKYKNIKGKYLFLQFYNVLINNSEQIKYSDISSCIRYDKNLREVLYIYLATFEEYIRTQIFEKFDVNAQFKTPRDEQKMFNAIIPKEDKDYSNLYYKFQLDFGPTIDLVEKLSMFDDNTINDFKEIKQLRNKVMHHNVVILEDKKNYKDMIANKKVITRRIKLLSKYLPKEYCDNFVNQINGLQCDRKDYKVII